ncbi:hypothetical protein KR018_010829, partial [Drosophila ironensis]
IVGLLCFVALVKGKASDHAKLKALTQELITAISEASSGKKYGNAWVPPFAFALEEVYRSATRRCFHFSLSISIVFNFCPRPPQYQPYPNRKPGNRESQGPPGDPGPAGNPGGNTRPPPYYPPPYYPFPPGYPKPPLDVSFELAYPDGSYFPWCYPPECPTNCHPPDCYICALPNCDPTCVPPVCFPPCQPPFCLRAPTCYPPWCPKPCVLPCVEGKNEGSNEPNCVPPYCPPPRTCTSPYCPKLHRTKTKAQGGSGVCPLRDIGNKINKM